MIGFELDYALSINSSSSKSYGCLSKVVLHLHTGKC